MPRGAKKRKAAKKKQENQPNNHSNPASASTHSHDVKKHDELKFNSTDDGLKSNSSVEREFEFRAKSNGVHGGVDHDDEAAKLYNGRSSSDSSSGNSSDAEDREEKVDPQILEENEKKPSSEAIVQSVEKKTPTVSEAIVQSVEKKTPTVSEPIAQSVEKKTPTVSDAMVLTTQEAAESAFADNGKEQEKEPAVTEPLLVRSPCPEEKTSWKSCCGLFEVFSGSGR